MADKWTHSTLVQNACYATWDHICEPDDTLKAVERALLAGYRHNDTVQSNGHAAAVEDSIKDSGVPRESVFFSTKINNMDHKRVAESMDESLKKLKTDYVDLILMHWPVSIDPIDSEKQTIVYKDWKFTDTWKEMEQLLDTGKARAIGVSNCGIRNLETLLESAQIVPAVCQVEIHVNCPSTKLVEFCKNTGIHVNAYSCLGSTDSPLTKDQTIKSIADARGKSIQQVLLVWGLKRGTSVIPKSVTESRIKENFALHGLDLTDDEINKLNILPDRFKVCKEWLPEKVFSSDKEGRDFYLGDKLFE